MALKTCRVCLNNTTATMSIFDKQDEIQFSEKIMKCVNIYIAEGDGLPDSICETCAGDLIVCYEFIMKCETSDTALRCVALDAPPTQDIKQELFDENSQLFDDSLLDQKEEAPHDDIYSVVHDTFVNESCSEDAKKKRKNWKSNPVVCDVCGFEAFCYSYLKLHMQEHNSDKPFSCKFCNSAFILKDLLNKHIRKKHDNVLHEKNKGKRNVNQNKQKGGPIQCVVCGLMVQSRSAMKNHSRTHTGEKPFCCDICDMRFSVKNGLNKHIEIHHSQRERKYTCETCGHSFYRKSEIIAHIRRHTDERPFSCKVCAKSFRQISSLIRHKLSHTGERKHSCPICLKMFYDNCAVQKHLSVHSDERKYTCHLCNKSVKSKSSLATHLKLHSNEKQNICCYCGSSFTLKGNLQIHISRRHSEKSGPCLICTKTFSDLEEHMRTHTGEKPFTCNLCDQAYAKKRSLTYHIMYKHENAEKFKCSIGECGRKFPNGKLLEIHLLKDHAKHTPFICPHCSRGFFRTSDLTRHLKCHMDTTKIVSKTSIQEIDRIIVTYPTITNV